MARSALLNVMVSACFKAGRDLARDIGELEQLQVSRKGPGDFVTAADLKAEKTIRSELNKKRPGYNFIMEESGRVDAGSQHTWVLDPIDGTANFTHGHPHFAISLALETDGQLQAGVIYAPATEELFTAERGRGAFLNDRRIRVAGRSALDDCLVVAEIPHLSKAGHGDALKRQRELMSRVAGIRAMGSAALALAYVASGRMDAYIDHGLSSWDVAAGLLLLREAGGFASAWEAKESIYDSGRIVAGNEQVHRQLRAILAGKEERGSRRTA